MKMKKVMMMAVAASLFVAAPMVASKCASCAEKMAIRQSIEAALAAAALASQTSKHVDSLANAQAGEPCCASCAAGGQCEGTRCNCGKPNNPPKPGNDPKKTHGWVAADNNADNSSCCAQITKLECALNKLADNKCCQKVKDMVKEQGQAAEKCCRHIRHELNDIEDLIISQTDAAAVCCSTTEALILSQTAAAATCCSVTEALIMSQTAQAAVCCSITETNIGDPCATVVDILSLLNLPITVIDTIDTTCLDTITLLKSIYALVAQIFLCACGLP